MRKRHTYFVSWVVINDMPMYIGNCTFATIVKGEELVQEAINAAKKAHQNAVVLSICKLD